MPRKPSPARLGSTTTREWIGRCGATRRVAVHEAQCFSTWVATRRLGGNRVCGRCSFRKAARPWTGCAAIPGPHRPGGQNARARLIHFWCYDPRETRLPAVVLRGAPVDQPCSRRRTHRARTQAPTVTSAAWRRRSETSSRCAPPGHSRRFGGNLSLTLAAYTREDRRCALALGFADEVEFVEDIPYTTRNYVKRVLANYERYKRCTGAASDKRESRR
jgi:hypothetical protein